MTSFGLVYRSLDIRYYDTAELATTQYPPEKRRAFLTELGWPNAAFSTNSRSIGLRFGAGLGLNSPSDDASLHDGKRTHVRVLWSGLCLNSLLFATLFLLPWVLFRRQSTCCYMPRVVVVAICVGLWIALLTAWACDLAHNTVPFLPRHISGYTDPAAFVSAIHPIVNPASTEWDQFSGTVKSSIGYQAWIVQFWKLLPNNRTSVVAGESLLSLGWPVPCLKGPDVGVWSAMNDPGPAQTKIRHIFAIMAMPAWWPGMLINLVFYALVIVVIVRGPAALQRLYRRYRNRCPTCGYPKGSSPKCTECGAALVSRSV